VDRLIYTAMAGANMLAQRQDTIAHNLANVTTTGFRAELDAFRAVPVVGPGAPTRVASVETTTGSDFTPGALQKTGNVLDAAIDGKGFFAVQGTDGTEAYTRDGGFSVGPDGTLQTSRGFSVLSDGGSINIPPNNRIAIGRDGTITAIPQGQGGNQTVAVARLKLVNPDPAELQRSPDGLFRTKSGDPAAADPSVVVAPESLENSNVNPVDSLVSMIAVARQFDLNMKLLDEAGQNASKATQLLSITS
jgi:flagellar basal-body rod protein FlgF